MTRILCWLCISAGWKLLLTFRHGFLSVCDFFTCFITYRICILSGNVVFCFNFCSLRGTKRTTLERKSYDPSCPCSSAVEDGCFAGGIKRYSVINMGSFSFLATLLCNLPYFLGHRRIFIEYLSERFLKDACPLL